MAWLAWQQTNKVKYKNLVFFSFFLMTKPPQARYWLLTIPENAYQLPTELPDNIAWLRGQLERGSTTNYTHWQIFASYKTKVRLATVKRTFGESAHAEPTRSSAAEQYVFKEDTSVAGTRFELGAKPFQRNSRTDWALAKENAKSGKIDDVPPDVYIKYYNTLKTIAKDNMTKPNDLDKTCGTWIYGPAGVGKSHWARTNFPNAYMKMQNKWWCGYQNEENVILDDFDSKQLGHHLKIWADRYAFIAETKGYAINIRPKNFVITSNYRIDEIFNEDEALCAAVTRRFNIIHIPMKMFRE